MKMPLIAPSILACDFGKVYEEVEMVNGSDADLLHVDIMDGHFVPNISFGFPVLEAMAKKSTKPLDVHLMISNPEAFVEKFVQMGASYLTVHYEATNHLDRLLNRIHELGAKAGVALNPHTPVGVLENCLHLADIVCLMSVNPGFGGQKFIHNTYSKVIQLREMINTKRTNTLIEIDGGVSLENASDLVNAGANILVAGSTVFRSDDPQETIRKLKHNINNTLLA